MALEWIVAGIFGALIGAGEIVAQFRDEPDDALMTFPALGYMLFNALAAVLALAVIRVFGWNVGVQDPILAGWAQVVLAGFGAMALLRASFFNVRDGEKIITIGPSRFLDIVLVSVKDAVDRKRAEQRGIAVSQIMVQVDFNRAWQALPAYCFGLLQNLPQDEQDKFAKKIALLVNASMSERVKTLLLGLSLMNLVGEKVLATAVKNLGDDINRLSPTAPSPAP
ncbi:MAG: hypothetical protein CO094_04465 [Anaerolineae bacterium CG_4_9_14_3_um_filter_57_17]|nr:hypothetical protein [bacterium]NCT21962.1 hypothetical protein [bacterium]OIO84572.1 MAG: hypothetical protein AUK01_08830 [Anaerolineae bacterium CG2_30_57_67]PJB67285.1 MAG: hypothetical protein CO094_04465 [Anaerolineae bacterium CG_4_9_14_3_um_filter_57_17]